MNKILSILENLVNPVSIHSPLLDPLFACETEPRLRNASTRYPPGDVLADGWPVFETVP